MKRCPLLLVDDGLLAALVNVDLRLLVHVDLVDVGPLVMSILSILSILVFLLI